MIESFRYKSNAGKALDNVICKQIFYATPCEEDKTIGVALEIDVS